MGHLSNRFIDLLTVEMWASRGGERVAYEIKTSRGDFLSEMKDHKKTDNMLDMAHKAYFVFPKGLVKPEEVPLGCGFIEIDESGKVKVLRRAPNSPVTKKFTDHHWIALLCALQRRGPSTKAIVQFGTDTVSPSELKSQLESEYSRGFKKAQERQAEINEIYGDPRKLKEEIEMIQSYIRKALGLWFRADITREHLQQLESMRNMDVKTIDAQLKRSIEGLKHSLDMLQQQERDLAKFVPEVVNAE